ncbi:type VII secretion protein EsaB [Staphylococcus sp. IVB6181]|uniref:EsaB/YukD family protein n=1 Tax=Staphylococcus sp. IVB6181 TaxID=2929481 RepID=UPI0021CE1881|nr:EsaB/YukD family protein [Staphylococcus sp. IVB6181]UXV36266.1 type VII secretion protein EsaB [Staphylococcus sp. IVB6181]
MKYHKSVTLDFTNYKAGTYDLSVPVHLPINTLIPLIIDSLDLRNVKRLIQVKELTKSKLLTEGDCLVDFHIADGDILKVI